MSESKEELYKIANQILDYSIERTGAHPTAQIKEDEMRWLLRTNSFRQILKDLEVLEILRKNLDLEIIDVCKTYGIYKVHIANLHQELTIDENEFKLVKEWIENGKKRI